MVRKRENIRTFHEKTEVYFYPMTEEEIRGYVETEEPMDKAGAYGIQEISLIREIPGGIIIRLWGLPLQDSIRNAEKWDWK